MKPFGQWFADFGKPAQVAPAESDLPDGVIESGDGEYEARCRGCDRYKPIHCDISEIPMDGYEHYCGGLPSCCP